MEILSISMDKGALKQLDQVQKKLGITSRSKMLRNAVLSMLKEYQALESLKGNVESVFVLTYKDSENLHVSNMLHKFEPMIKTELHQHHARTCIDILNTNGPAEKTREFFNALKKNKCVYSVSCNVVNDSK